MYWSEKIWSFFGGLRYRLPLVHAGLCFLRSAKHRQRRNTPCRCLNNRDENSVPPVDGLGKRTTFPVRREQEVDPWQSGLCHSVSFFAFHKHISRRSLYPLLSQKTAQTQGIQEKQERQVLVIANVVIKGLVFSLSPGGDEEVTGQLVTGQRGYGNGWQHL